MDFILSTYHQLLTGLKAKGYTFQTFRDFIQSPKDRVVVMRHDVDKRPGFAMKMAELESSFGIKSSYFFRIVPAAYNEEIIKQIADLGHEVGYHYEDLAITKGDTEKAIAHFESQLKRMRAIADVKTICMHGSPMSKWDNRKLWEKYDYRDFGIIAEPYFDVDYSVVLYMTDTGRRWDGEKVSIRDKVTIKQPKPDTRHPIPDTRYPIPDTRHLIPLSHSFKSTKEIISRINELPNKIMINTHPQRWTDSPFPWLKELVLQRMKNVVKKLIVKN